MIVFELSTDISHGRIVYWLGCTNTTGKDIEHEAEIYEQLDAELVFNL